jgi:uncharacterized membrane protein
MKPKTRALVMAFAVLGLFAATASSYVHYQLLNNPGYASFCDVNPAVSCAQAYLSRYGSIFGIPVALAGVAFFAVVLSIAALKGRTTKADTATGYVFALSTIGLIFVLYLAWASYAQLGTFCILCATTYVAVIGIFIVTLRSTKPPLTTLPGNAIRDLSSLVGSPLSLLLTIGAIVFAGFVISAFRGEPAASVVQEPAYPALTDQQRSDLEKWWVLQPKVDLGIPDDGAAVVVVKFSDFMCPACRQAFEWYKPIVARHEATGKVRFVTKHYPLEAECNKHAPSNHYASCEAAAAVIMARATGNAAAVEQWLFSNQSTLTPQTVKAAARDIGGIRDFDAQYARVLEEVTADANLGGKLGVNRTPTFYIAGRKLPNESLLPPQYFDYLIELALRGAT